MPSSQLHNCGRWANMLHYQGLFHFRNAVIIGKSLVNGQALNKISILEEVFGFLGEE
jgi:hypothetical protein